MDLLTSDGFARIELKVPDHLPPGTDAYGKYLEQLRVSIALSDVRDCFHRLKQPKWLSQYFCLDPVPASWVSLQRTTLDGVDLSDDSLIYPAAGSLTMGFTWSLYFAHEAIVLESTETQKGQDQAGRRVHHYVYVDNLGILSVNKDTVGQGLREVEDIFEQRHLVLHPGAIRRDRPKHLVASSGVTSWPVVSHRNGTIGFTRQFTPCLSASEFQVACWR